MWQKHDRIDYVSHEEGVIFIWHCNPVTAVSLPIGVVDGVDSGSFNVVVIGNSSIVPLVVWMFGVVAVTQALCTFTSQPSTSKTFSLHINRSSRFQLHMLPFKPGTPF